MLIKIVAEQVEYFSPRPVPSSERQEPSVSASCVQGSSCLLVDICALRLEIGAFFKVEHC
jgi:hypothetical protein